MNQTPNGYLKLRLPLGQMYTHISLASGKTVSPNPQDGYTIVVSGGDAAPLLGAGFEIVPPMQPVRRVA
jgi:hypothetical protein